MPKQSQKTARPMDIIRAFGRSWFTGDDMEHTCLNQAGRRS